MKQMISLISILLTMNVNAQETIVHFSHTVSTTASKESIWKIWIDVPNWKIWDTGIKDANLDGAFADGAKGKLTPAKGPKTKFVITDVVPYKAYTIKTRIPFGWLVIKRSLEQKEGHLLFTHDIEFTGLLKKPLANKLGKNFKAMLPNVMNSIKLLAEE